jgi:hypothetical protein
MTATKQEAPARGKQTKQPEVSGIKVSGKRANSSGKTIAKKAAGAGFGPESGIDKEDRRQMIAEAAYFRYQQRGDDPGCDIDDWLAAEQEIDRMLDF